MYYVYTLNFHYNMYFKLNKNIVYKNVILKSKNKLDIDNLKKYKRKYFYKIIKKLIKN